MKKLIHQLLPPFVVRLASLYRNRNYGWHGNFESWSAAKEKVKKGYSDENILKKVTDSALLVKQGGAAFERDSMVFTVPEYSWPLLTILMMVAAKNDNCLSLIDFGGSLGSTYFQHQKYLSELKNLDWMVVEQESFVSVGKQSFENKQLKFYSDLGSVFDYTNADIALLGSSLQYIEDPFSIIKSFTDHKVKYIVIERSPFIYDSARITIQKVNPNIYSAEYVSWVFNEANLISRLNDQKYSLYETYNHIETDSLGIYIKSFIFKSNDF